MPRSSGGPNLPRRALLRSTLALTGLTVIGTLAQACAPATPPTPTPAPKPTEAPKPAAPAATSAPAAQAPAPTATSAPAAATATSAPAAKPTEAPKPTAAAAPTAPPKAKITGKLSVLQFTDWHPDHNKYVENEVKNWAKDRGYPLDHSYVEGYVGAGNLLQKLTASVQAGDAPDVMMHTTEPGVLQFLGIIQETDAFTKDMIKRFGKVIPGTTRRTLLDGKWWGVPYYCRSGGWWARTKAFGDVGIDPIKDFSTVDKMAEACLKASKPDKELYGWGATANRSGDGETLVREAVMLSGGQLTEETGQLVVLNKDPFREGGLAGLNFLKDLFSNAKWKPMMPPGILSWTDTSNNEAYLAAKILVTNNAGTIFAKAVFDKNPVWEDTYLLQVPKGVGPKARAMMGGDGARWWVLTGSKNKDAAFELFDAMLTKERQLEVFRISTGYAYPNYEWGWDEAVVTSTEQAKHVTPQWKKVAWDDSGYLGAEWPGPMTPWVQSLANSNFWTDMFGEILGGKSVEKTLEDAHNRAVKVAKEFGFKGA